MGEGCANKDLSIYEREEVEATAKNSWVGGMCLCPAEHESQVVAVVVLGWDE